MQRERLLMGQNLLTFALTEYQVVRTKLQKTIEWRPGGLVQHDPRPREGPPSCGSPYLLAPVTCLQTQSSAPRAWGSWGDSTSDTSLHRRTSSGSHQAPPPPPTPVNVVVSKKSVAEACAQSTLHFLVMIIPLLLTTATGIPRATR